MMLCYVWSFAISRYFVREKALGSLRFTISLYCIDIVIIVITIVIISFIISMCYLFSFTKSM